ncbi:unnamed protein product [Discosporangium mesarthrocarpum]
MRAGLVQVLLGLSELIHVVFARQEPVVGFWSTHLWNEEGTRKFRTDFVPPTWNSTDCMKQNGHPHLQFEVDHSGYLLLGRARGLLGEMRWTVENILGMAKALNRTLVEPAVWNSMVISMDYPDARGISSYWDMDALCSRGYRILDLQAFQEMIQGGLIKREDALSVSDMNTKKENAIHANFHREEDVREYFKMLKIDNYPVLVLERLWPVRKPSVDISMVQPNPYHLASAQKLLEEQGWSPGNFISVQWMTERSRGDLRDCYHRYIKKAIEGAHKMVNEPLPVFVNNDIFKGNSEGYHHSKGQPESVRFQVLKELHDDWVEEGDVLVTTLAQIKDSGIRGIVAGLVVANSRMILVSSQVPRISDDGPWETVLVGEHPGYGYTRSQCEKLESKHIDSILDWRLQVKNGDSRGVYDLFPKSLSVVNYLDRAYTQLQVGT